MFARYITPIRRCVCVRGTPGSSISLIVSASSVRYNSTVAQPSHHPAQHVKSPVGAATTADTAAQRPKPSSSDGMSVLSEVAREFLREQGFTKLTDVQRAALPVLLAGKSAVLTGQTGTGKTLAYVIPTLQQLKNAEVERQQATRPNRPRALIMLPTRELAQQVLRVCKSFSHVIKLRCVGVVGGKKQNVQRKDLEIPTDALIGTPGRLAMLHSQGYFHLSDVKHVVIDEADTLLDVKMGFMEDVDALLRPLQSRENEKEHRAQIILTAATASSLIMQRIQRKFPTAKLIHTSNTHILPRKLHQEFISVGPAADAKHNALMSILSSLSPSKESKAIVFCQSVSSARSTAHFLTEAGISNASLHGDIPPIMREKEFSAFYRGMAPVLVCTDAAARGLDFVDVGAAINFDFPRDEVDYIHRVGRVARAGKAGKAFSLVQGADKPLANRIRDACARNRSLIDMTVQK